MATSANRICQDCNPKVKNHPALGLAPTGSHNGGRLVEEMVGRTTLDKLSIYMLQSKQARNSVRLPIELEERHERPVNCQSDAAVSGEGGSVNGFAIAGLACGFSGSVMLASLALFRRKQGNWFVYGDLGTAYRFQSNGRTSGQDGLDTKRADALLTRARWWSRIGFALLAVGFLLQLISTLTEP
jgi:hypothetical protein